MPLLALVSTGLACEHVRLPCAQTGVLGQGTFGVVVRAVDPDNSSPECPVEVAIKLLPRGEVLKNFKTYVAREILHQSCLEHPFIVSVKEVRTAVPFCHHLQPLQTSEVLLAKAGALALLKR